MASAAVDPNDTYRAGARLSPARTEASRAIPASAGAELGWLPLRAPAASSAAAPRRAARRPRRRGRAGSSTLLLPPPAPLLLPASLWATCQLPQRGGGDGDRGDTLLRVVHQLQAPGLRSPDLSREEEAQSLLMRCLRLEPPTVLVFGKGAETGGLEATGPSGPSPQQPSSGRTPMGCGRIR